MHPHIEANGGPFLIFILHSFNLNYSPSRHVRGLGRRQRVKPTRQRTSHRHRRASGHFCFICKRIRHTPPRCARCRANLTEDKYPTAPPHRCRLDVATPKWLNGAHCSGGVVPPPHHHPATLVSLSHYAVETLQNETISARLSPLPLAATRKYRSTVNSTIAAIRHCLHSLVGPTPNTTTAAPFHCGKAITRPLVLFPYGTNLSSSTLQPLLLLSLYHEIQISLLSAQRCYSVRSINQSITHTHTPAAS